MIKKESLNKTSGLKNSNKIIFDLREKTLIFLIAAILIISGCKRETRIYRFEDHIKLKNVVSSPLRNLQDQFETIVQNWHGDEMESLILDQKTCWAIRTIVPVLNSDTSRPPEEMKVYRGDKEMKYSSTPVPGSWSWNWRRYHKTIHPFLYEGYKKGGHALGRNAIILSKKSYFIAPKVHTPAGEYSIEIQARGGDPENYAAYLSFFVDDTLLDEGPVTGQGFKTITKLSRGTHNIKVLFSKTQSLGPPPEKEILILKAITLRMNTDLILISPPERDEILIRKERFRAIYKSFPENKVLLFPSKALNIGGEIEIKANLEFKEATIDIACHSEKSGAFLVLYLDDKEIDRKWIIPWQWRTYNFSLSKPDKKASLKLKYIRLSKKKIMKDSYLFIHSIVMRPSREKMAYIHLYKTQKKFQEYAANFQPDIPLLNTRLKQDKYTFKAILAPPKTDLKFRFHVPRSSTIEFGYGIFRSLPGLQFHPQDKIRFSVIIEHDKKDLLFSTSLRPGEERKMKKIRMKRIDLNRFQERMVTIEFLTEWIEHECTFSHEQLDRPDALSYWFTPAIIQPQQNKNILLISIDTLRADHLGCYGYSKNTSPHIDKLSQDGVLFLNNFSHSPSTLPSHMSMLSGLYPTGHEIVSQKVGIIQRLDPSISLVNEILRKRGYFTGAFTGGGYVSEKFGFSRGFDFYYEDADSIQRPDAASHLYELAGAWLEENKNKPFFLFLHTYQVHSPYSSPEPYNLMFARSDAKWKSADMKVLLERDGKYDKFARFNEEEKENIVALYDGGIRYTDERLIGPLIEKLRTLGLYDKTMIVITSDHGEEFYEHGGWTHDHTLYNELIKVPLIIKFPQGTHRNEEVTAITRIVDIVPTILATAGISFNKKDFDGRALTSFIDKKMSIKNGISLGYKYFYFTNPHQNTLSVKLMNISLCEKSYKLILNKPYPPGHHLFKNPETFPFPVEKTEFYDLAIDPEEQTNLEKIGSIAVKPFLKKIRIFYQKAKKLEIDFNPGSAIDENLRNQLRALGYIQ